MSLYAQSQTQFHQKLQFDWKVQKLIGDNLKVALAKFSTFELLTFFH
jgi:hypothetical protein